MQASILLGSRSAPPPAPRPLRPPPSCVSTTGCRTPPDPLGFEFVQKSPAGCAALRIISSASARSRTELRESAAACGSFIKPAQVVGVAPHVIESAHSGIGIRERRDIAAIQNRLARRHFRSAHPARQDRFAVQPGQRPQLLRRSVWDPSFAWGARITSTPSRIRDPWPRSRPTGHTAPETRRRGCRSDCCGSSAAAGAV